MKKLCFVAALLALSILAGCAGGAPVEATTAPVTLPPTTAPATAPTTTPTTVPTTAPAPSMVLDGVGAEEVITYFSEVCLDAELFAVGQPNLLQKWMGPIMYTVSGAPTREDLDTLQTFFAWLNTLEGFPGIVEATAEPLSDLNIHFVDEAQMLAIMGDGFGGLDGAVTFWYNGDNAIYDAVVCIRTDIGQQVRNSVIIEEIYNGLGAMQDTSLRPDSIIYQGYSEPQWLSPVDELILRLLYHPDMKCGMTQDQCAQVIRSLYQ